MRLQQKPSNSVGVVAVIALVEEGCQHSATRGSGAESSPEWSRSQTQLEDAVGDGTSLADPGFEWGGEAEETTHGGS